eukprot:TRINITY_DN7015_c0_g1_i5.p1 TRINITY_DN7015_c0_g1~~TRINITY_DN7015_c0_g1_i5.p1  ORF type:complete len:309 (-),score=31.06 TRINITY_DN7015_c0_g1_i5:68-994(-)
MKNVHKTYLLGVEGVPALRGVTLNIKRGEFVVILGKSGSGKTSLLNIIGTIDKPTKGDLVISGMSINSRTTDEDLAYIRLKRIGFVFQTFNLISSMNAQENVELPMILDSSLPPDAIHQRSANLLQRVGMSGRLTHLPSQLSGGEQQRVTIARAVANRPDILLLDEPTGDLDTKNSDIIMKMLTDLNREEHITLIMVTHDTNMKHYAHRVVHMLDGKVQRIEVTSQRIRTESLDALHQKVSQYDEMQLVQNDVDSKDEQDMQPVSTHRQSATPEPATEFRDPRVFYAFHQHARRLGHDGDHRAVSAQM